MSDQATVVLKTRTMRAEGAIDAVFGVSDVPRSATRDALEGLLDRIQGCLDALDADERQEAKDAENAGG